MTDHGNVATEVQLPDGIERVEGNGGLTAYRITTAACTAEVYQQGAHVTSYRPTGEDEVLWVSSDSAFRLGKDIRGGIPICAPWFAGGRAGVEVPQAHGFVRSAMWRLDAAEVAGDTAHLIFKLDSTDGLPGADDYPADLAFSYELWFGPTLRAVLTVGSQSSDFILDEALHTYLRVADVRAATVTGLVGAPRSDKVSGVESVQHGELAFAAETDVVFTTTAPTTLHDAGREVTITKQGSESTVVWNPWSELAAKMSNFGDDEWPGMVCIETANALDRAVHVSAGEPHVMGMELSVTRG